ncbi:MAG: LysM peptidoglycan-binding domain-containing protein [Vulcanimicrobiota bacterium]
MNPVTAAVQNGMGPVDLLPGRRQVATTASTTQSPPSPAGDVVSLSRPPEGDPKTIEVVVDAWGKGKNSSLSGILLNQGYPREALTARDAEGHTMLERVAAQNGLRNPDLIHPGQRLKIPIRAEASSEPEHSASSTRVTVDPWGKGPNSSLEGILKGQGYSPAEIYARDDQGKTMIDRVAAANGLTRPDRIRAGQQIEVPGRQPAATEAPKPAEPPREPETERPVEPPQEPEPPAAPERPKEPELPKGPEISRPTEPAGNGRATLEMSLMLDGAREGTFNRNEFQALNAFANRYEETRAEYSSDGFTPDELRNLGQLEKQYGDLYVRFQDHDRSDINFSAQHTDDPRVQVRMRHLEESGVLFDGFKAGSTDYEQALEVLMRQRQQARNLGLPQEKEE